ncbi:hypothetical protein V1264_009503 [Littorina saxatilis]|uniref:G-protein coupled receptors family 1 profile domain-containing protein n=1 Tax=Littorina saxatilis TaxID=31220 RepID=A0AAN9ARV6_9CAEN
MNTTQKVEDYVGDDLPEWIRILFVTLHVLTSVNGVLGCVLIFLSLHRNTLFRSATCTYSAYLVNLAIADLYFAAYHFPMMAVGLAIGRYPVANKAHCQFTGYTAMTGYNVYLLTLTAISFDRYMRVCHNLVFRRYFSQRCSIVACLLTWVVSAVMPIQPLAKDMLGFDSKIHVCFVKDSAGFSIHAFYLAIYFFPIACSGFFNFRIFAVYWHSRRKVNEHLGMLDSRLSRTASSVKFCFSVKSVKSSDLALLRSLIVIYLCLFLLVTPIQLVQALRPWYDIPNSVYVFFIWLVSINNSNDWIVYGYLNTRFREDFRQILYQCGLAACLCVERPGNDMLSGTTCMHRTSYRLVNSRGRDSTDNTCRNSLRFSLPWMRSVGTSGRTIAKTTFTIASAVIEQN